MYNRVFISIIIIGAFLWIIIYFFEVFKIRLGFWNRTGIRDLSTILSISVLSPGFVLNIIKYIKNNSNHNKEGKVFKNYHIHECFAGIVFVITAFILLGTFYFLYQFEAMREELRLFLAIPMIFLILFLLSGIFLIFRDRRDLVKFKFVGTRDINDNHKSTSVFNPITLESVEFFKNPKFPYYSLALFVNSFSVNLLIHGADYLPVKIFNLSHGLIVLVGFIICFITGGLIGIDWYHLFAKIYPKEYKETELILLKLRKDKNIN
ncbi:MAG: hypothetical protein ACW99L_09420 [Promethearchaeota archaeon]|jgi:hypothetical protein